VRVGGLSDQARSAEQGARGAMALPLVTLYLTDRCNSRCVTCDYWRHGRDNLSLASLQRMLPDLERLGTRVALLSGGEPLMNPEWRQIAAALGERNIRVWLLSSGLALAKYAPDVAGLCSSVTVSLDGTTPATYRAIRGLDAFDNVCAGIRAAVKRGIPVGLRVTVQRSNYRELPRFVSLARELGVTEVSFLAVDVANAHAFGRREPLLDGLALTRDDVSQLDALLDAMQIDYAAEFARGFIAESPRKLRRLRQYFAALAGLGQFPPVRCNAPEFSAVVGVDGIVSPCFFIRGPGPPATDLPGALEAAPMRALRADIRAGRRGECERCVCPLWRAPPERAESDLLLERAHA
jgi:MoaA/NifB/PqqE/SkfB family radical SAM enzyme